MDVVIAAIDRVFLCHGADGARQAGPAQGEKPTMELFRSRLVRFACGAAIAALSIPIVLRPSAVHAQTTATAAGVDQTPAGASVVDASNPDPWRTDRFFLETSIYTWHFHYDPAHVSNSKLILGEWNITEQWLVGASYFLNSFGQPSEYIYGGWRVRPIDEGPWHPLYFKVSAGLVHGYKDQYRDKIPFNHSGIAPAVIPSMGYCFGRVCPEIVIFGTAGMMLNIGVTIP